LKNALIVFASVMIIFPSMYSTAMMTTNQKSPQERFMKKFEPTYKIKQLDSKNTKKKTKQKIFQDLFEKIQKK